VSVVLENGWSSSGDLQLFTDNAGHSKFGCGVYFNGAWTFLQWPENGLKVRFFQTSLILI